MEQEITPKLIFGLSPKATIINSVILMLISQLLWSLVFVSQIPDGVDYNNIPSDLNIEDNVAWYYYLPTNILALIMGINWVEHTFKIERTEFSWRAIKIKYIYLLGSFILLQSIAKVTFLFIILSLK